MVFGFVKSVFGYETTEILAYHVMAKRNGYEIRSYPPYWVAETDMTSNNNNDAFFRLFYYITGSNQKITSHQSEKIAMTAPVLINTENSTSGSSEQIAMTAPVLNQMSKDDYKKKVMSFTMPSKYNDDNPPPQPTDPKVRVRRVDVSKHRFAVIEFNMNMDEKKFQQKKSELLKMLETDGEKVDSSLDIMTAGYNPPYTLPWLRKNEIIIPLL